MCSLAYTITTSNKMYIMQPNVVGLYIAGTRHSVWEVIHFSKVNRFIEQNLRSFGEMRLKSYQ